MTTKYDIGDIVLIQAKVCKVKSNKKGEVEYTLDIAHTINYLDFNEDEIIRGATTTEIQDLRFMVNALQAYCKRCDCCNNCVIKNMKSFEATSSSCTGWKLSNEQLLENKDLIIQKYKQL